ncbi:MAG: ATP-binding protein [Gemmatimonadales bacterium]
MVRCDAQRLVLEDYGDGITDDLLPRIFEPRFSTTTSGSGLGLSIVKRLVEGWGATVSVRSQAGEGTAVSIAFPAA